MEPYAVPVSVIQKKRGSAAAISLIIFSPVASPSQRYPHTKALVSPSAFHWIANAALFSPSPVQFSIISIVKVPSAIAFIGTNCFATG